MKIVFVCTGNICRSPMGEAMLRHELAARGCTGIEVSSCGTWGLAHEPATADAVTTLRGRGIDLSPHRSRALDAAEIEAADLVVAMTSVQVREIAREAPEALPKVRLVKELAELDPDPGGGLPGLLAATRPPARRSLDVDDPMGLPVRAYQRAAGEIEAGVRVLAEVLCPRESGLGRPKAGS